MKKLLIFTLIIVLFAALSACGKEHGEQGETDDGAVHTDDASFASPIPEHHLLPTDYSGRDNLSFIAWAFGEKSDFQAITTGNTTASVLGVPYVQSIYGKRDVKDGKVLKISASKSTLVNLAEEKYFAGNGVLIRRQTKKSLINGENTVWQEGEPSYLSVSDYNRYYGVAPGGYSDYIINDNTLISCETPVFENGRYSIKCTLDPASSTEYYRRQVKTLSGSSSYPEFSSIEAKFVFDENWNLNELNVAEVYDVSLFGGITCRAEMHTVFTYGNADMAAEAFYSDYAAASLENDAPEEVNGNAGISAALQAVFRGDRPLEIKVTENGKNYTLYALVFSDTEECRLKFGDLHLALRGDKLYFISSGKTYCVNMHTLAGEFISDISDETSLSGIKELLGSILGGDTEETEEGARLSATAELFGAEMPVNMEFSWDGLSYSLKRVYGNASFIENEYSFNVSPFNGEVRFEDFDYHSAKDLTRSASDLASAIKGEKIKTDFELGVNALGLKLDITRGHCYLNLASNVITATGAVSLNGVTHEVSAVARDKKLFFSIDGKKFVTGGSDYAVIEGEAKKFAYSLVGEDRGAPLAVISSVLEKTDLKLFDFDAFVKNCVLRIISLPENSLKAEFFDVAVSVEHAKLTFGEGESEMNFDENECTDVTGIVQLIKDVSAVRNNDTDAAGNTAIRLNGTVNILPVFEGYSLISVPVRFEAFICAEEGGKPEIHLSLSYDYMYIGIGLLGIFVINGDTTTDIAVKGEEIFIARHQTSYGKRNLLSYSETACDYMEYRHMTVGYAYENMVDVISFVFNLGSTVQSLFPDYLKDKTYNPEKKPEFVKHIKDISLENDGYLITLDGASITGSEDAGDVTATIAKDSSGMISRMDVSVALKSELRVDATIYHGNLTAPVSYSGVKAKISSTIDSVKGSGASLLDI